MRQNAAFARIRNQYLNLYRISRITRYDAEPDKWLPPEYLSVDDVAERLLKPIENDLGPLISKSVEFKPLHLRT